MHLDCLVELGVFDLLEKPLDNAYLSSVPYLLIGANGGPNAQQPPIEFSLGT
jgi:hypothetical protein